jgi:hypothetical protein
VLGIAGLTSVHVHIVSFSGRRRAAAFRFFMEMMGMREMGAAAILTIRDDRS